MRAFKNEHRRGMRAAACCALAVVGAFVVLAVASCSSKTEAQTAPAAPVAIGAKVTAAAKNTIVAAGDIACPASDPPTKQTCAQAAVANRVRKIDPANVLLLGDLQYPHGGLKDFQTSFGRSWGALRDQWRPAPGNHEYYTPRASGYFKFFGKKAGNANGNYSFDVAGWHFIALNSNCETVACTADSKQGKWLAKDLADNATSKCIAAYWHAPLFSSGEEHGNDPTVKPFWTQLRKAHADLVLNGHDHDYERFAPQDEDGTADADGVREFVVGTGGYSHYPFGTTQANSQKRIAGKFGALSLQLSRRGYRWRFVSSSGRVLDRGAARCH
jgi:alkaline phosphatase